MNARVLLRRVTFVMFYREHYGVSADIEFTCDTCEDLNTCENAFELYNTDGACFEQDNFPGCTRESTV